MEKMITAGRLAAGISCIGGRRNNEDTLLIREIGDTTLLAVADGVGGHCGGEVASALATKTLLEEIEGGLEGDIDEDGMEALLAVAFARAHEEIVNEAHGILEGMGTTLVAALIHDSVAVVANIGDSRAYLLGEGVIFRTRDHSLRQAVLDGQIKGDWTEYPLRGVLTRSLGHSFEVDTYHVPLHSGETLLLCSDGLHDVVPDESMLSCMGMDGPSGRVECLLLQSLPKALDNVTVAVYTVP
ncbi:MAG: protein phosphatase 2C domain-containing protein [Methanoregulaceae archaeon]|nr:protein phosphatase 2C domain-containing protein [Methanoregulaceae archaeon]